MRLNSDVVISTGDSPAVLVPYKEMHVKQYHQWMQDPEMLYLTASEPLTLDQEFYNMKSWREDETKMTFIVLDSSRKQNVMAGDVNLYLLSDSDNGKKVAEIEVMIADRSSRRKGLAKTALRLLMAFAVQNLHIDAFVAKILENNKPSISLFSKVLKFDKHRRLPAFQEMHYRYEVTPAVKEHLEGIRRRYVVESFANSKYAKPAADL